MSFGWLRRLVGGDETVRAASVTTMAAPPRSTALPTSGASPVTPARPAPMDSMRDAIGAVPEAGVALLDDAAAPPPPTPVAELVARLARHPAAAGSPDATGLLEMLAGSPDTLIRQLPAAARASLALCDDPDLTRRQLAEKLSSDPALVQALLRTANSAAFGAGKDSVISIEPALDRIGVGGARAIIFANAVDGALSRPGGEFNEMVSAVWNHMVSTAPLARALARAFGTDPEEAFSIALLHDVGKLVIFDRISVFRAAQRRDVKLAPAFVHALLGELHEPLGAAAARAWSMGERSARAIGAHHCRTSDGQANVLAEITFVAELADHAVRTGTPLDLQRVWFDGQISADLPNVVQVLQQKGVPYVY